MRNIVDGHVVKMRYYRGLALSAALTVLALSMSVTAHRVNGQTVLALTLVLAAGGIFFVATEVSKRANV